MISRQSFRSYDRHYLKKSGISHAPSYVTSRLLLLEESTAGPPHPGYKNRKGIKLLVQHKRPFYAESGMVNPLGPNIMGGVKPYIYLHPTSQHVHCYAYFLLSQDYRKLFQTCGSELLVIINLTSCDQVIPRNHFPCRYST